MDEQFNEPVSPEPAGVAGWFDVWMKAVTKPNEQTYVDLASSSTGKTTTAFLWIFIGSLVSFFFASLVQGAVMRQLFQQFGMDAAPRSFGTSLITAICGAPIAAVVSVVFFAAFAGVVQWIAKMFGGKGTFEQLLYVFAAISVPFTLVSAVLTLLGAIPYVGACFGILSFALSIYALVLEVMAVKGVNNFGWGQAVGSLLLPVFVIFCCVAVVVGGMVAALGPAIRDTFNQVNPGF